MLLAGAKFVPLWSQTYLPWLFVNSGLLTGLAAIGLLYILVQRFWITGEGGNEGIMRGFAYGTLALEMFEIFILFLFFQFLLAASNVSSKLGEFIVPNGGREAYEYVITGPLSGWFWGGGHPCWLGVACHHLLFQFGGAALGNWLGRGEVFPDSGRWRRVAICNRLGRKSQRAPSFSTREHSARVGRVGWDGFPHSPAARGGAAGHPGFIPARSGRRGIAGAVICE